MSYVSTTPRHDPTQRYVVDGSGAMSQARLLLALCDRLVADLERAAEALAGDLTVAEAIFTTHTNLTHAQRIVEELQLALDPDAWEGSASLGELYEFLHGRLVTANLAKDRAVVEECLALVRPLVATWHDAFEAIGAPGGSTTVAVGPASAHVPLDRVG
jgi:flagellar protein FliS